MITLKVGDRVKAINNQGGYGLGKDAFGTVKSIGRTGFFIAFKDYSSGLYFRNDEISDIELIKENTMEVTRENLNAHTIYVVTKDSSFYKGTEVRLYEDDKSSSPKFKDLDTGRELYESIANLAVLGYEEEEIKEVTLQEIADALGVEVSTLRIKE